ncbi:Electron transfer flavoprotein-ubiquinone oxidoreductase (modular protein) (plasmid) [Shinella sp. WSC3-e]|nr:Electron transfer flavoprotein-ubiquinone oxidoreductase (modular protein) [Rhizobiaceae bacterium]CAK7260709.1 Electron transfer flavoprotein-ubiquinone oxidoreductase (modular protein) [Shinella sp. WSC3-e]
MGRPLRRLEAGPRAPGRAGLCPCRLPRPGRGNKRGPAHRRRDCAPCRDVTRCRTKSPDQGRRCGHRKTARRECRRGVGARQHSLTLGVEPAAKHSKIDYPKPDDVLTFGRLSSVFLSNTNHEEDQPIHLQDSVYLGSE